MERRRGFTLLELLIVVAVITTLLGILLPAVGAVRKTARTMHCLSNMRNMEVAHSMYVADNDGAFVDIGLGAGHDETLSWVNTLEDYYGSTLLHRSPVDDSPYWPGGSSATATKFRRCSYGVNNYLAPNPGPDISRPATQLEQVASPSATVHFVYMSESDVNYAVMDHLHVEKWDDLGPAGVLTVASSQVELHAHGGEPASWDAVSNYGFLDGHAQTLKFRDVYQDSANNQFDPATAR